MRDSRKREKNLIHKFDNVFTTFYDRPGRLAQTLLPRLTYRTQPALPLQSFPLLCSLIHPSPTSNPHRRCQSHRHTRCSPSPAGSPPPRIDPAIPASFPSDPLLSGARPGTRLEQRALDNGKLSSSPLTPEPGAAARRPSPLAQTTR